MHCNSAKAQAFPLVLKVSSRPNSIKSSHTLKSLSSSLLGVYPKPSRRQSFNQVPTTLLHSHLSYGFNRKTGIEDYTSLGRKPRIGFHWFCLHSIGTRDFSDGSPQRAWRDETVNKSRKNLPWISGYKNKQSKVSEKSLNGKITSSGSTSTWAESADKFLMKNGVRSESLARTRKFEEFDNVGSYQTRSFKEGGDEIEEAEEVEEEIANDPRWDRIKSRFRRGGDIESGGERPEMRRWNKQDNWGRKTWREATDVSSVPKMVGEPVYGVGPVLAALSARRREFYALYVQEGLDLSSNNKKKKDKKGFERVKRMSEKLGLTAKEASKHDLNMVVDNRPHQGLVLDASPLEMVRIRELDPVSEEEESGPLWVALDEVMDPQNLGAIIRSAYYFGAAGVVLCAKNSAPLSGVVSKASAGSVELMELRSCKNMMQFLSASADNGWRVLGGSVSSKAVPLKEVLAGAPTVLVLGSEGTGLRPLVERSCTQLIRIQGNIPVYLTAGNPEGEETNKVDAGCSGEEFRSFLAVESLNVSVAAGVLLHHLTGTSHDCRSSDKEADVLD
ncbi:hypothetical protein Sjap_019558 [Stephania japonica]|uniref:rRNA methyltransferase 1, mitochondrial n=1 Tax=Stephania japonica TaxID=461633 RepID=A0AAP0EZN6_9MAGN